jgi:hypothetical protein
MELIMKNTNNEVKSLPALDVSIFDPSITITKDHYAISFVKYKHTISDINEHSFLVIQTPTTLYRKEIFPNEDNPKICTVKEKKQDFNSPIILQAQFNLLIWEDAETSLTIADLCHRTWSINKAQEEELLIDIAKDRNDPPAFHLKGYTSVLREGKVKAVLCKTIVGSAYVPSVSAITYFISIGITKVILTGVIASSVVIAPLAIGVGVCAGFSSGAATAYEIYTKELDSPQHNCGTWCIEKLTNLNDPNITKDLDSNFIDKFVYLPGLHIYPDQEEKGKSETLFYDKAMRFFQNFYNPIINYCYTDQMRQKFCRDIRYAKEQCEELKEDIRNTPDSCKKTSYEI